MKKLAVVFFVAVLGLALTAPAFALEHEFGGYWRVRMYNNTNFDGVDNDVSREGEVQLADTRTRLYYTAIINDNLKFVNKFEMDAVWGDDSSYGDIGADGKVIEVKNTYIDFNYGDASIQLGTQGQTIQRGFMFDDDFSGITIGMAGATAIYMKAIEDAKNDGSPSDSPSDGVQVWHLNYAFGQDALKITPNVTYEDLPYGDEYYFLGLDVDGSAGGLGYWATFIYEGGDYEDMDVSAYLIGAGVDLAVSDAMSINFEAFYATGDDDDDEINAFTAPAGQSYYWSEIMGLGIFDDYTSNGSCADGISNVMAANVGASLNVTEKLTLALDLWYAQLAEDDANGNTDLGTEVDLNLAYTIIEGLRLHAVAAYLFAGDATTGGVSDDANPFEIGAQFSIKF